MANFFIVPDKKDNESFMTWIQRVFQEYEKRQERATMLVGTRLINEKETSDEYSYKLSPYYVTTRISFKPILSNVKVTIDISEATEGMLVELQFNGSMNVTIGTKKFTFTHDTNSAESIYITEDMFE